MTVRCHVADELTLAGRASYVEAGLTVVDAQAALHCLNELQRVVVRQLLSIVHGGKPAYPDDAFLTVLVETAKTFGCTDGLRYSLERAKGYVERAAREA